MFMDTLSPANLFLLPSVKETSLAAILEKHSTKVDFPPPLGPTSTVKPLPLFPLVILPMSDWPLK